VVLSFHFFCSVLNFSVFFFIDVTFYLLDVHFIGVIILLSTFHLLAQMHFCVGLLVWIAMTMENAVWSSRCCNVFWVAVCITHLWEIFNFYLGSDALCIRKEWE